MSFPCRTLVLTMLSAALFAHCPGRSIYAQSENELSQQLRLYITTQFDSSFTTTYKKYFDEARSAKLVQLVTDELATALVAKFEEVAIRVFIDTLQTNTFEDAETPNDRFAIKNTLFIDADASLNIKVSIWRPGTNLSVVDFHRVLKTELLNRKDWWDALTNENTPAFRIEQILHEIADGLVARVDGEIAKWIIESKVKIRVGVRDFVKLGGKEEYRSLESVIASIVESELTRSETIIVYVKKETTNGTAEDAGQPRLNYIVDGKFFEKNDHLWVDVRCIKEPYGRILTSRSVIIEPIGAKNLFRTISDISKQLKRTMESDFRRAMKSLAIVATPPIRLFTSGLPGSGDRNIAKEIVRVLTQKMRLLTTTQNPSGKLNMQIMENTRKVDEYLKNTTTPNEMLADLDVDYLLVLNYENLGLEIRLSANLHSYDREGPAISQIIHEQKSNRAQINRVTNEIVFSLLETLCSFGFMAAKCDSFRFIIKSSGIQKRLDEVTVPDLRHTKSAGIRIGVVADRSGPALFGEKEAGKYFEAFLSVTLPVFPLVSRLPVEFATEASFGLDLGRGSFALNGITSMNGFLSFKATFLGLRYSRLPLLISAGSGIGAQGLRYEFSTEDEIFQGDFPFQNSTATFATTFFVTVEFPLWENLGFEVFFRRIKTYDEIEIFKDVKLLVNGEEIQPVGKLGGKYFVAGLKYHWR